MIGASEGWGGGVARNMSSFSVYVPVDRIVIFSATVPFSWGAIFD